MLAATCPYCRHAIFADDEAALATLNCPACQQIIGALVPDLASEPITELPVIFTPDRRCLHDYIAGTVVVRVPEQIARERETARE